MDTAVIPENPICRRLVGSNTVDGSITFDTKSLFVHKALCECTLTQTLRHTQQREYRCGSGQSREMCAREPQL